MNDKPYMTGLPPGREGTSNRTTPAPLTVTFAKYRLI